MHSSLTTVVTALALALVATASLAVAQTPPEPIVRVEGLRQISPRVHIIPDNSVPAVPNVGYIVGESAVLVIDTGLGPPNGAAVYEVTKKLAGTKALYLVTTHVHPEHDLGAQAFPDTTRLIRSTDQLKDIAESGLRLAKVFASRSALHAELLKDADFRKADVTFEREYDLDLGGVRAKLMAMGANHTLGDTAIWSTRTASCFPATSPCVLSRSLQVPIRPAGNGSRAWTGSRPSSPPLSCRATARRAMAQLLSPVIAPT